MQHQPPRLIKDLAPEIGRGVKVSYSLRFF